jgi:hypothetical protein
MIAAPRCCRRCHCDAPLGDARKLQVEDILVNKFDGRLVLTEGEIRRIQALFGLTRAQLLAALNSLALEARVYFDSDDGVLVARAVNTLPAELDVR